MLYNDTRQGTGVGRLECRSRGSHEVTPVEVEEVCQAIGLVLQGSKGRLVFIGPTQTGRLLAVILDPEPEEGEGVYYPVTARPAARKERRLYQQHVQGGQS